MEDRRGNWILAITDRAAESMAATISVLRIRAVVLYNLEKINSPLHCSSLYNFRAEKCTHTRLQRVYLMVL